MSEDSVLEIIAYGAWNGGTNGGDDKYDPGPLIRFPYQILNDSGGAGMTRSSFLQKL